jgi:hypothetical protein
MRRFVITLGVLVTAIALLAGTSAPSGATATRSSGLHGPAHGSRTAPPDSLGRYAAGLTTVEMVDPARVDRTLTVDIWYPADEGSDAPTAALDLLFTQLPLPGVLASPDAAPGSFPLVVFSPELLPIDEAHRVTDLYVVSFLTKELKGSSRYGRYLTTEYAERNDLPVALLVKPERHRGRDAA